MKYESTTYVQCEKNLLYGHHITCVLIIISRIPTAQLSPLLQQNPTLTGEKICHSHLRPWPVNHLV